LNKSNWEKAVNHIFNIKLIQKLHEFSNQDFKQMLINKFKESALKAYLCRSANSYSSFSVDSLLKMFEMEESVFYKIVNKMILRNKLQAHIDLGKRLIVLDTGSNEVKELQ